MRHLLSAPALMTGACLAFAASLAPASAADVGYEYGAPSPPPPVYERRAYFYPPYGVSFARRGTLPFYFRNPVDEVHLPFSRPFHTRRADEQFAYDRAERLGYGLHD